MLQVLRHLGLSCDIALAADPRGTLIQDGKLGPMVQHLDTLQNASGPVWIPKKKHNLHPHRHSSDAQALLLAQG